MRLEDLADKTVSRVILTFTMHGGFKAHITKVKVTQTTWNNKFISIGDYHQVIGSDILEMNPYKIDGIQYFFSSQGEISAKLESFVVYEVNLEEFEIAFSDQVRSHIGTIIFKLNQSI
jgi:hypothetical protein